MLTKEQLMNERRVAVDAMEKQLLNGVSPDERMFALHSSEDRIVLSHALFLVMTKPFIKSLRCSKSFLILRQYEEEMLSAFLSEDDEFSELLHFCNVFFEVLPFVLKAETKNAKESVVRKFIATVTVAVGYGGDMPEALADELLDDIDFKFNKVYCKKIEQMLPTLNKFVNQEMQGMF